MKHDFSRTHSYLILFFVQWHDKINEAFDLLKNQVRIIGGKWRGRKLPFPDTLHLRPTGDRIRETLFNWLTPILPQAVCLDLFAGSGALGFEALSRGAKTVFFIDQSPTVIDQLRMSAHKLQTDSAQFFGDTALNFLQKSRVTFDVIFLDPPFQENLIDDCLRLIHARQLLNINGMIYIEEPKARTLSLPNSEWIIKRAKQAGKVNYYLIENTGQDA